MELLNVKNFIRGKDIAEKFGIARSTVDNWAKYGYLTRYKVGRNVFYDTIEVSKLAKV